MPRWLLGPQEGGVLKGLGGSRGRKGPGTPLVCCFSLCQVGMAPGLQPWAGWAALERGSEGAGGDPGQEALSSPPPPRADFNTANHTGDIWPAPAAQGIPSHTWHLFPFHKKPVGDSIVPQMVRTVWKGLTGLLGSAVGGNGIRGQQLWGG